MNRAVQLPTGPQPGWEVDSHSAEELTLQSISKSLVVLQSLRQSRNAWLSTIFPKFSVKARGGRPAEVTPPPHTTKAHGKYDIHIGPHVFSSTAIYEVHYLPPPPAPATDGGHTGQQASPSSSAPGPSTSGVQTSLSSVAFPTGTYVTPALSAKVAEAARSDPVLANLLNAVINRTATEQQVKTLGYLIQSLNGVQSLEPLSTGDSDQNIQPEVETQPPRPFDVILEFHERPSERFILPRGDVVCELAAPKSVSGHGGSDLIITHCLPFSGTSNVEQGVEGPNGVVPEIVSFRLSRVSQSLWHLLSNWAGGPEKIEQSRIKLSELAKQAAPRSYLQYRLPEGELLSEIRSAMAPSYTMKPIKPAGADSNRAKRKSVSRRPTVTTTANPPSTSIGMPAPKPMPVKRRSQPKTKAVAPPPIACHACGKTDVPLMMGGRYCRECINAGKPVADIPQVQPNRAMPMPSPSVQGSGHANSAAYNTWPNQGPAPAATTSAGYGTAEQGTPMNVDPVPTASTPIG